MFPEAEYIAWAKQNAGKWPRPLSWSNVPALTLDDLRELGVELGPPELSWSFAGADGGGPLRELLARRKGVSEDRILVGLGTTGVNFAVLAANLEERGAAPVALVETPVFTPLVRTLEGLGYRVVRFERAEAERWAIDPGRVERAAGPGPIAVVVVTTLHNPTGVALSKDELSALARFCESKGALLLSDEVYREFAPEEVAPPGYPLSEQVCSTESLSKVFGLADIRIGWAIGSPRLIARARRILDHVSGDSSIPSRAIAAKALDKWDAIVQRARTIARGNRALVEGFLSARKEISWTPPAGGVHGLLRVADAETFVERALRDEGLLLVPGRFFEAPGTFRIGWGGPGDKVAE
ncbi:MAG: pyridoxal phosphate-dependent aminotransferase, partial [Planctomycetota bacterium]